MPQEASQGPRTPHSPFHRFPLPWAGVTPADPLSSTGDTSDAVPEGPPIGEDHAGKCWGSQTKPRN